MGRAFGPPEGKGVVPVSIVPLIVLLVVISIVMIMMLRMTLRSQVSNATTHLQELSQEYLKKQEELKAHLESVDRQYQEQVAKAKTEIDRLRTQAEQEMEVDRQRVITHAREEAERIVRQAMESRDALRRELEQSMERHVIDQACALIQQTLSPEFRQQVHTQWWDELTQDGFGGLDRLCVDESVQEAHVRSAFPMTREQQQHLQHRLRAKLNRTLTLHEEVDPSLVAGFVLSLGSVIIDGSMASQLQKMARRAQGEAAAS